MTSEAFRRSANWVFAVALILIGTLAILSPPATGIASETMVGVLFILGGIVTDQSDNYRQIALIAGYHPCSFPPPTAYDAGLKARFAVVLSSYRPDKEDIFFDAELFVLIADALLQAIPHDSLDIEFGVGPPRLKSLTELTELYASQNEIDHEPPNSMKVFFGDRLVAVEETEPWVAVGGPAPYHDSFTMSFYTAEERTAEFRRICEAVACQSGVTVTEFHEAQSRKEPFVPWWRRPLGWFGAAGP